MTLAMTARLAEGRSPRELDALAARVRAEAKRRRILRLHPTPMDLAVAFDRSLIRTPALNLVNRRLAETVSTYDGRLVISVPPQEFKTNTLRWLVAHTLVRSPGSRIVFASYAASLARTSGRITRGLVTTHSSEWGISVSRDHADASDWQLQGHDGGMFTCGVGGSLTGRPADGMIIDDPVKGRQEADSTQIMTNLHEWWSAVARTRLAPGAWVVVVQVRWDEDDMAGRRISEGWPAINIPALADGHAPDALDRPLGGYLISTRGRTPQEWRDIRADVGEREWAAMYQGMPAPPAGGWFLQNWFDRDRVSDPPADTYPPFVYVDPADNTGGGDEAGIIVGRVDPRRHIYVGPDYTLLATTARWVRVALLAVVRHEAAALVYEKSLSGLARAVREGWTILRKQALMLRRLQPGDRWPLMPDEQVVTLTMDELTHEDDSDATRDETFSDLLELWPHVPTVLSYPPNGPAIRVINPRGKKLFRLQAASPALEQRRVHVIGRLPEMEHEAVTWQPGQASPNRLDTLVHLIHDLSASSPGSLSKPTGNVPTRSTRRGMSTIPRSTRRS